LAASAQATVSQYSFAGPPPPPPPRRCISSSSTRPLLIDITTTLGEGEPGGGGAGGDEVRSVAEQAVQELHRLVHSREAQMAHGAEREVVDFLAELRNRGAEHTPEFYAGLLGALVEAGRMSTARSLFDAMERSGPEAGGGCPPNGAAHAAMILGYCKQRRPERALPLLEQAQSGGLLPLPDQTWVFSQLIHGLGRARRLADATAVFEEIAPAAYAAAEEGGEGGGGGGAVPRVLYRRMIEAACTAGHFEQGLAYAAAQQQQTGGGMSARESEGLVGYLIQGAFNARSLSAAQRLWQWLQEPPEPAPAAGYATGLTEAAGDGPTTRYVLSEDHYVRMIQLFGRVQRGSSAHCVEVLRQLLADPRLGADGAAVTRAYNAVLMAVARNRDIDVAVEIFEEIPSPDVSSFNALIRCYGHARQLNQAFATFRDIASSSGGEGAGGRDIEPDVGSYCALIEACAQSRRAAEAEAVFAEMRSRRQSPDEQTYIQMLHVCRMTGNARRGHELFAQMVEQEQILPSERAYTALVHACAGGGDSVGAWGAYEQCLAEGHAPTLQLYNALITACGQAQDSERAFRVLSEMAKHRVSPDVKSYAALLRASGVAALEKHRTEQGVAAAAAAAAAQGGAGAAGVAQEGCDELLEDGSPPGSGGGVQELAALEQSSYTTPEGEMVCPPHDMTHTPGPGPPHCLPACLPACQQGSTHARTHAPVCCCCVACPPPLCVHIRVG
jgi:pentatricopeptide repeat protein